MQHLYSIRHTAPPSTRSGDMLEGQFAIVKSSEHADLLIKRVLHPIDGSKCRIVGINADFSWDDYPYLEVEILPPGTVVTITTQ